MLLSETVWTMNTRQIAGSIVRDEYARQGLTQQGMAEKMHAAKSTLARMLAGAPTVTDLTLRQIEGVLDLPRRFLTLVIEGDRDRIAKLDMDADLKRFTLDALSDASDSVRSQGGA